ncbi:hypothetical protein B0H14DRAFT_2569264 [Mycena olivaceomarginata]|nr:hypothetical protein B0H14DRAFT_2569264 [Mycena olivaceomarginata]
MATAIKCLLAATLKCLEEKRCGPGNEAKRVHNEGSVWNVSSTELKKILPDDPWSSKLRANWHPGAAQSDTCSKKLVWSRRCILLNNEISRLRQSNSYLDVKIMKSEETLGRQLQENENLKLDLSKLEIPALFSTSATGTVQHNPWNSRDLIFAFDTRDRTSSWPDTYQKHKMKDHTSNGNKTLFRESRFQAS